MSLASINISVDALQNLKIKKEEEDKTMTCMLKPTRRVYKNNTSGIFDVYWNKKRYHWEVKIIVY